MKMNLKKIHFNILWEKWLIDNPYENDFTRHLALLVLKIKYETST